MASASLKAVWWRSFATTIINPPGQLRLNKLASSAETVRGDCVTNQQHSASTHLNLKSSCRFTADLNNVETNAANGRLSFAQLFWVIAERQHRRLCRRHGADGMCLPRCSVALGPGKALRDRCGRRGAFSFPTAIRNRRPLARLRRVEVTLE